MRVFLLHDPRNYEECARFSHVGTWSAGKLCDKCGQPSSRLVEPLQVEWEPDSESICDFSWCGHLAVIKSTVGRSLQEKGFNFSLGAISHLKPSKPSSEKQVPFPYSGPELSWLVPTQRVSLNERKSKVRPISDCSKCGQKKYTFKTEGLVIDKANWSEQKLFCIDQYYRSRAMFVTEIAMKIMLNLDVGNVAFSEAGVIR